MTFLRTFFISILVGVLMEAPAMAVDSAEAVVTMSGYVPVVFSLTARGLPGDMDLTPNVSVVNRRLALLHFKYNTDVDVIDITTDSATGAPYNAGGGAPLVANSFLIAINGACFSATMADTSVKSGDPATVIDTAASNDLANNGGAGIEEDCSLVGSWTGAANLLPLAGKYDLKITVTMTSK